MFRKQHPPVGAAPGTLSISDDASTPVIRMLHYGGQEGVQESIVTDGEQMRRAFDDGHVTWIDVQGFGDQSMMQQIGKVFALHPLLLEDVVNLPQRAKSETYGDQLLLIVKMVSLEETSIVELQQISIIIGRTYVITFQEHPSEVLTSIRNRILSKTSSLHQNHADYLAYSITDTIVDAYYPVLEVLGDRLEVLEDLVVMSPSREILDELNRLKNRLVNLRRAIWPQREAIHTLVRDENAMFDEKVRVYLRDIHDHCVQTCEVVEMYREMVSSMINTYLTAVANRTNEVMKVLTIVSTVFIPLTFIAGVYGMNFHYMPELAFHWGYPIVWAVMLITAAAMLLYFRRIGWFN